MIKVIHLSHSYSNGGAAIACQRIHLAVSQKISSQVLINDGKSLCCSNVINISSSKIEAYKNKIKTYLENKMKLAFGYKDGYSSLSIFNSGILKKYEYILHSADIIHLHWINKNLISIEEIKQINKPIIWTLHDMWMFMNARHYSNASVELTFLNRIIEKIVFLRKKNNWINLNIHVVVPSQWMEKCFKQSIWSKYFNCTVIPNPIDLKIWGAKGIKKSRELLGLSDKSRIVLFGAVGGTTDRRKGFAYLESAIKILACNYNKSYNIVLATFGGDDFINNINGIDVINFGKISDANILSNIYSAADVFVSPATQEAFGQTSLESLACGTPVIAFDETGAEDLIEHKINGYLAKNSSVDDLLKGIIWSLENYNRSEIMNNCRRSVLKFDSGIIADKYIEMYKRILISRSCKKFETSINACDD